LGLNTVATVITAIPGYADPSMATAYTSLLRISVANLVISVVALVPGYWISFLVIDKWGRKPLQYMGFLILTAIFLGMVRFIPAIAASLD
jgi:PHS family inorganic phosphate transporter-like MFS transporter